MTTRRFVTGVVIGVLTALGLISIAFAETPKPYGWTTIPFGGGGFVDGFLYHPTVKDILYARTDVGGMYRFDFHRQRWIPLDDGFGRDDANCFGVVTMAVDPHKADRLYATCGLYLNDRSQNGALLRSEDQGNHWQKTPLPFKLGGNAMGRGAGERLQVDPNNSNTLWLGTNQDGLWVSHDQGKSFSRSAYRQKSVSVVLIDGATKTLFVGSGEAGEGLFQSKDGGVTFSAVPGSPKMIPHQMALAADGTLFVTFADTLGPWGVHNGAVWKLKDDAWRDISPAKPTPQLTFGYSGIDLDLQHPGTVVVSTSNRYPGLDDLYVSRDGGAKWLAVKPYADHDIGPYSWLTSYFGDQDADSENRRNMGHWMDAVKINPFDSKELLYGTGYGVWRTHNLDALDKGAKVRFRFVDENFEETVILGLESPPTGPHVLMAAGDVAGTAFDDFSRPPTHGFFTPTHETNQGVAFAALRPNIVVRSADNETTHAYISLDGSESWTPMPSAPEALTGDWHTHRAGKIAISANAGAMVWVPENLGAYWSADKGKTWVLSQGWPAPLRGQEAVADAVNDRKFYAFDRKTGTVLMSGDSGRNFSPLVSGLPIPEASQGGQLRAVPGREDDVWLALPTGLYHVVKARVAGMKNVAAAWQITFGKAAHKGGYPAIFLWGLVSAKDGLWRSDNEGKSWVRINDAQHSFGALRAMAGDPRQFGVLYLSPDGRGTLVGKPPK